MHSLFYEFPNCSFVFDPPFYSVIVQSMNSFTSTICEYSARSSIHVVAFFWPAVPILKCQNQYSCISHYVYGHFFVSSQSCWRTHQDHLWFETWQGLVYLLHHINSGCLYTSVGWNLSCFLVFSIFCCSPLWVFFSLLNLCLVPCDRLFFLVTTHWLHESQDWLFDISDSESNLMIESDSCCDISELLL